MSTVTFSNRGVTYTVSFEFTVHDFNSGPGLINIDASRSVASLNAQQPWQTWLRFTSRALNSPRAPAWNFEASRLTTDYSMTGASAQTSMAGQQIGFIQTVERLQFTAQYEGLNRLTLRVLNSRDVNPHAAGVDMPFFNVSGRDGGPQSLIPTTPMSPPTLNDSPDVVFRVLGHQRSPRHPLRTVTAEGSFLVWLIVKHDDDAGDEVSSLQFLYHAKVEMNRSWTYNNSGDRDQPGADNFRASGGQQITEQGVGRGPLSPAFSDRTAHEHLQKEHLRLVYPFRPDE